MTEIVKAGENLFLALGFPPHEAEILQLRAELIGQLQSYFSSAICRAVRPSSRQMEEIQPRYAADPSG